MKVDTTTPALSPRALVMASNTTTENRRLVIRRAQFDCDQSVRIIAPVGLTKRTIPFEDTLISL